MKNMDANNFPLTLLYDGKCPLCMLEMDNLKARNTAGLLLFVDISQAGFDPVPYGASVKEMSALLHGVRPDGTLVIGAETLRLAYRAVGLGYFAAPTALPGLKPVFDAAYVVFARNRYGISRVMAPLIERIAARRAVGRAQACAHGECAVDASRRPS